MLEVRRIVRGGVREADGILECSALGVRLPGSAPETVAHGLCSDELFLCLGGRRWLLPPWFTSRSRLLPSGVLPAAVMCVRHFAAGMGLIIVVLGACLGAGLVFGSLALVAVTTLGLGLLGAVLVHELGHVLAYRILVGRSAPAVLIVRGASCRVLRLAGRPAADLGVVLAGPLAPLVVASAGWPLFGPAPFAVIMATLVALGHVAGLAMPIGDGAALREIARGR